MGAVTQFQLKMGLTLRAVAVAPLVAGSGVVDMDIARDLEPCTQDLILLRVEALLALSEDVVHLPSRDVDPDLPQLLHNQRLGHVCVVVLVENKADQRAVEVATEGLDLLWERCHNRLARWRLPPLPVVQDIVRFEHKTLNRVVLISLERASCWNVLDFDNQRFVDLERAGLVSLGGATLTISIWGQSLLRPNRVGVVGW